MEEKGGSKGRAAQPDSMSAWEEKDQRITVTEGGKALFNLTLNAKVDSPPADIYAILTDPNTVSMFRNIKECTYRRVLEEDDKGRRKLEVGHRAIARFLFISITFETHLHVWEDDEERTIKFAMAKPGMMQKFDGCWRVKPFTQQTLDSIYNPDRLQQQQPPAHHGGPFHAAGLLGFLAPKPAPPAEATSSLVTLEQSILPRGPTPPGIKGLVRGLCAHQIRTMMEDLRRELARRRDGTSTTVRLKAEPRAAAEDKAQRAPLAARAASLSLAVGPAGGGWARLWDQVAPIHLTVVL